MDGSLPDRQTESEGSYSRPGGATQPATPEWCGSRLAAETPDPLLLWRCLMNVLVDAISIYLKQLFVEIG